MGLGILATMTGAEIRREFLRYFEERGHRVVASGLLVPEGDPTLMFVNAGMVPFKRVFLGEETRDYVRAATSQKCMRVSGKHNDLEEVGRSPSHQTFFEMLGNFSFGDYFKKEAIEYGWDFLTNVAKIAPERLVVSIHERDDEAYDLWRQEIGLGPERIFRLPDSENFWQMADTGPCGPCSEIHLILDQDAFEAGRDPSGNGYVELWNLVFMQFERRADGSRVPLPKPSIDTGLGLERLASVLQGVSSNYDTDLFRPLLDKGSELSGKPYGASDENDVSLRVVADHARACTFLIGEGILPSNEGRGYVLRRVLRRAARHGVLLGLEEPFLNEVANVVIDEMGAAFPEIRERRPFIQETIKREEERFLRTLGRGLVLLDQEVKQLRRARGQRLSGEVVFKLYDTYGFPTDLTEDILRGHEFDYDRAAFDARMREQAERARAAWKGAGEGAPSEVYSQLASRESSRFVGYDELEQQSRVTALLRDGAETDTVSEAERVEIAVETTPFYAESGGQVGDVGTIEGPEGSIEVEDTQSPVGGLIVHSGRVSLGRLRVGDEVTLRVDSRTRAATVRNHSGTHLLHWALRRELGPQVMQAGSLVAPDRLRFDFAHDEPLTDEQITKIEHLVNDLILQNLPSKIEQKSRKQAIDAGAIAMFGEKYGATVRVVSFGPSTELCGGTHAGATGDIGSFRIISQSAIGSGVRRVEAQTGLGVLEHSRREADTLRSASQLLKAPPSEVPERVRRLLERQRELERELEQARARLRRGGGGDPMQALREVAGVRLITSEVETATPKELRGMIDELKQRIRTGVVVLGTRQERKVALAVGVTSDLTERLSANDLVKQIAPLVGGSGGGRPDFAQAGGTQGDKIRQALDRVAELIEESLA